MGTLPESAPEPERNPLRHDPVVHGSKAAIAAAIFACVAAIAAGGSFYVNWSNRSDQKTQQANEQTDAHTNALIDLKVNPAVNAVNAHVDEKFGELSSQIHALDVRIARLEGPNGRISKLETRTDRQISLARIIDPARTLATIRAEIQIAKTNNKFKPVSDLIDYKNAVRELPSSAYEYWQTVAAIINYQSEINQMSHQAPDPAKISRPCAGFTEGTGGNNLLVGTYTFDGCVVDLDTMHNYVQDAIYRNSVIRYHGGPIRAAHITFVNCAFVLDFPANMTAPAYPSVLFSLLDSPDQKTVTITTHS
jgi:hypothetical protein